MFAVGFDPYARQSRLTWANRLAQWRQHRGEFVFHLLAAGIGLVLLANLALAQRAPVAELLTWLWQQHAATSGFVLLLGLTLDQHARWRDTRLRLARDWLSAQPLSAALLRRRRLRRVVARALWQAALLTSIAGFSRLPLAATGGALALIPIAAILGHALPLREASRLQSRETPFATRGRASFWRWQWIEAGASLAPQRMAWALLAILLVPRGGWVMAGVAFGLMFLVAAGTAWQRSLAVIPVAQRWIATQPIAPSAWLRACLAMPLLLLGGMGLLLIAVAFAADSLALALVFGLGVPAFGGLHLAVVASERLHPERIVWLWPLHAVLLASAIQSLPPLAPVVWAGQLIWLGRRSVRE